MSLDKVPAHVKELAQKITDALTYDADGAGTLPETFFADNLPEDVSLEAIKRGQEVEQDFTDALVLGHGNRSRQHLADHKDLDRTSAGLIMGHNSVRASYDRQITVRVPGTGEEKPKYGHASVKFETSAGQKRGNLKKIMDHLNQGGIEQFGK